MVSLQTLTIAYATEDPSHGRESRNTSVAYKFWWWTYGYHTLESVADVQGHAVYDDSGNGGYENYAIFLYGRLSCSGSKINVGFYVTALYHEYLYNFGSGTESTRTYWGPPPIDLITWDGGGAMDYGATTPGEWSYTEGGQFQSYSFSATYTPAATCTAYPQTNPPIVEDYYRNMGYFSSKYADGSHQFKALVRLHVHNTVATQWGAGVISYTPGAFYMVTKILAIRVKVNFKYYWTGHDIWNAEYRGTHSHLLGDGVNPDNNDADINEIPFVVGSC